MTETSNENQPIDVYAIDFYEELIRRFDVNKEMPSIRQISVEPDKTVTGIEALENYLQERNKWLQELEIAKTEFYEYNDDLIGYFLYFVRLLSAAISNLGLGIANVVIGFLKFFGYKMGDYYKYFQLYPPKFTELRTKIYENYYQTEIQTIIVSKMNEILNAEGKNQITADQISTFSDFNKDVLNQFYIQEHSLLSKVVSIPQNYYILKKLYELFLHNQTQLSSTDKISLKLHDIMVGGHKEPVITALKDKFEKNDKIDEYILGLEDNSIQNFRNSQSCKTLKSFLESVPEFSAPTNSSSIKLLRALCGCSQIIAHDKLKLKNDSKISDLDSICAEVFLAGLDSEKLLKPLAKLEKYCKTNNLKFSDLLQTILITSNPNYGEATQPEQKNITQLKYKLIKSNTLKEKNYSQSWTTFQTEVEELPTPDVQTSNSQLFWQPQQSQEEKSDQLHNPLINLIFSQNSRNLGTVLDEIRQLIDTAGFDKSKKDMLLSFVSKLENASKLNSQLYTWAIPSNKDKNFSNYGCALMALMYDDKQYLQDKNKSVLDPIDDNDALKQVCKSKFGYLRDEHKF